MLKFLRQSQLKKNNDFNYLTDQIKKCSHVQEAEKQTHKCNENLHYIKLKQKVHNNYFLNNMKKQISNLQMNNQLTNFRKQQSLRNINSIQQNGEAQQKQNFSFSNQFMHHVVDYQSLVKNRSKIQNCLPFDKNTSNKHALLQSILSKLKLKNPFQENYHQDNEGKQKLSQSLRNINSAQIFKPLQNESKNLGISQNFFTIQANSSAAFSNIQQNLSNKSTDISKNSKYHLHKNNPLFYYYDVKNEVRPNLEDYLNSAKMVVYKKINNQKNNRTIFGEKKLIRNDLINNASNLNNRKNSIQLPQQEKQSNYLDGKNIQKQIYESPSHKLKSVERQQNVRTNKKMNAHKNGLKKVKKSKQQFIDQSLSNQDSTAFDQFGITEYRQREAQANIN